jgi:hypothetical protein
LYFALFVLKSESVYQIGTQHDTALEQYRARKQAVAPARGRLLTRAVLFRDKVRIVAPNQFHQNGAARVSKR